MLDAVFPVVPGWDVSGVVVRLGVGRHGVRRGRRGHRLRPRGLPLPRDLRRVRGRAVRTLARKPRNLTLEEAAGMPLTGLTAYQVLAGALQVKRGETVLVHAAAGGVGSMAVQLARHLGARVIGTASEANHDFVRSLGGEPVAYGEGLAERVRGLAPEGVDAAFDTVGGEHPEGLRQPAGPGRAPGVDRRRRGPRLRRPLLLGPARRRGPHPGGGTGRTGRGLRARLAGRSRWNARRRPTA